MNKILKIIAGFSIVLAMTALILLAFNQNNEISDLKNQNEILVSTQEKLENDISKLIEEKAVIEKQRDIYSENYEIERAKVVELREDKKYYVAEVERLYLVIDNLGAELEELRNNQGAQDSISELETQLAAAQTELAEKTAEVERLTTTIAEKETEIENLNNQILTLNAQLATKDTEIQNLIVQLNADSTIFRKVFDGSVTAVTAEDLAGFTEIRPYAFAGCENLVSIEIPDSVTVIGDAAFYGCTALTTVVVNETSNLSRIDETAFSSASLLESFYVPKTVSYIGFNAFHRKSLQNGLIFADPNEANLNFDMALSAYENIKEISFPEGTYALRKTLLGNSKVEKIVIPSTVQVVGENFLSVDSNLDVVVIKSEFLTPDMIAGSSTLTINEAMYVPDSLVEAYKACTGFNSKIINKIKPLSEYVG